jgi:uncharacterized repeat protein (TIGR04138 family)
MTTLRSQRRQSAYHANAYQFVFAALQYSQERLGRDRASQAGHISGTELLDGIREMARQHFGLMAKTVFATWGVTSTEDIGRIVFELIESGRMRKTEDDQLDDFVDVYDFSEAFENDYEIDTMVAFQDQSAQV